jgi:hypothetical protein
MNGKEQPGDALAALFKEHQGQLAAVSLQA